MKKVQKSIIVLLTASVMCMFTCIYAQPSNWEIRNYSTKDGLSSNHINCMLKDSLGFMWFGGNNGLMKFDGYNFTPLKYKSGNLHPVSNTKVLSIIEDKNHVLWIGTIDGLFRFDPAEPVDHIKHYRYFEKNSTREAYSNQPVNFLCEDKTGLLWMSCIDMDTWINYGLRTFNVQTETFNYLRIDSTFSHDGKEILPSFILKIANTSDNELWLATTSGITKYDYNTSTFESFIPHPDSNNPLVNQIGLFYEDRMGNFWVSSRFGLYIFDRVTRKFGNLIQLDKILSCYGEHAAVWAMDQDLDNNLWLIVNNSLYRLQPTVDDRLSNSKKESWTFNKSDLGLNSLHSMYVENPSSAWFPAPGYGVYHVEIKRRKFNTIIPNYGNQATDRNIHLINAVFIDTTRNIWFSSVDSGFIRMDISSRETDYFIPGPTEQIHAINSDEHGNIWLSSIYGVLSKIVTDDQNGLEFKHYYPETGNPGSITLRKEFSWKGITAFSSNLPEHLMIKDQYGTLWFNSGTGYHDRYDPLKDEFIHLDHRYISSYNNDSCVLPGKKGEIWFPSRQGLLRILPPFTRQDEHTLLPAAVIRYQHDDSDSTSILSSWARSIYFSEVHNPGTIWVGTISGGLNKLIMVPDMNSPGCRVEFKAYTRKDGLCDNNVLGILEDDHGYLWLSTSNGLSRFDPVKEEFRTYIEEDGLPSNLFTWSDPGKSGDGELYFPTEFGLLHFYPDSIQDNPIVPAVVITDIKVSNKTIYPGKDSPIRKPVNYSDSLHLKYKQNSVSFEFAALNYEKPGKNEYKYKLEGFDKYWNDAGTKRSVTYTNLEHGNYTFRVIGSNNDGVWNTEGVSLHLKVDPPPWLTWWAYSAYSLVLIGLILLYRNYLMGRAKLKTAIEVERIEKDKLRELEHMKSRFFTNLSHEFRTPLTLILGPLNSFAKIKEKKLLLGKETVDMMRSNASRLLKLINQLLDITKLESGSLPLRITKQDLGVFTSTVAASYASLAEYKKIHYTTNIPSMDIPAYFDSDKVEKILGNLISNAIKFTPVHGTIIVILHVIPAANASEPDFAEIIVSDTGKGIPEEHQSKIFDRFYQVGGNDFSPEQGTGIGLSLVKELVDIHKGTINLKSVTGKGSVFTVRIPVSLNAYREEELNLEMVNNEIEELIQSLELKPGAGQSNPDAQQFSRDDARQQIILVVEDHADLQNYISGILEPLYSVITANDGKSGLEKAQHYVPDLIISDIMMPGLDGFNMCKRLRANDTTSHIPVLFLTARADQYSRLKGLDTGAEEYMIKPFDAEELRLRVRNMTESRIRLWQKFTTELLIRPGHDGKELLKDGLLNRIYHLMEENMGDPGFNIDKMAAELHLSTRQLFRKVMGLSGYTPNKLLQNIRLRKAAELLKKNTLTISEIMFMVGFNNPSYFAKCFKDLYKESPSEYSKKHSGYISG